MTSSVVEQGPSASQGHRDGRDRRWTKHRIQKRRELVEHTLRAIKAYGPGVAISDIAAQAGTSKTVLYRHFGDRTGLYLAVAERVSDNILAGLAAALTPQSSRDLGTLVRDLADAYTHLVERDTAVYRFVLNRPAEALPGADDPISGVTERIATHVAQAIGAFLRDRGREDDEMAATWAHGVVGFVRAATNHWVVDGMRRPRERVVAEVVALLSPAFSSVSNRVHRSE